MQLALTRWFAGTSRRLPVRRAERAAWAVTRLEDRTVPAAPAYAVGAGANHTPEVAVYDTAGALLVRFNAYDPLFLGGVNVAVGDVNGDGIRDVITSPGATGGPDIRVFDVQSVINGATNGFNGNPRPLAEFNAYDASFHGGVFVAAGDINGDGKADIITGPGKGGGPHVKAFSGADGGQTTLLSFNAYAAAFSGGVRVGAADFGGDDKGVAGSHNGDAEIITGPGPGGGAHIRLWDYDGQINGPDNFANLSGDSVFPGFTGGVFVSGGFFTNNVDDQGFVYADMVISADAGGGPIFRMFRLDAFIDPARRDVAVYVPANQAVAGDPATVDPNYPGAAFYAYNQAFRNGVRVGTVADLNGDGRDEVITGAGVGGGPDTRVLSGLNMTDLHRFNAFDPADRSGVFVG